jgi:hypothetical protein
MKKYLVAALFSAISATSVQAIDNQKTVCSHGSQTRVIEVAYTSEDNVPCEVRYSKEEGSQTLWSATNKAGFCEEKAAAFVEKQIGWGWACEASINTAITDEAEIAAEAPVSSEAVATETTALEAAIPEIAPESEATPEPAASTTEAAESAEPVATAE